MSGAPLPLLGTFHELSVATRQVRAAVEFYEQLGFEQARRFSWERTAQLVLEAYEEIGSYKKRPR